MSAAAFPGRRAALTRFWSLVTPLHEVEPPGEPSAPAGRLVLGLLGTALGAFLASVDQRLTAVPLPDMIGNFDYGHDEGSWIATAYSAGDIVVVPMTPWLATVLSVRRMVAFEVTLFVLASAAVPLVRDYSWVIGLPVPARTGRGRADPAHAARNPAARAAGSPGRGAGHLRAGRHGGAAAGRHGGRGDDGSLHLAGLFYVSPVLGPVALFLVLLGMPVERPNWRAFRGADYFGVFCLVLVCVCIAVALGHACAACASCRSAISPCGCYCRSWSRHHSRCGC